MSEAVVEVVDVSDSGEGDALPTSASPSATPSRRNSSGHSSKSSAPASFVSAALPRRER